MCIQITLSSPFQPSGGYSVVVQLLSLLGRDWTAWIIREKAEGRMGVMLKLLSALQLVVPFS